MVDRSHVTINLSQIAHSYRDRCAYIIFAAVSSARHSAEFSVHALLLLILDYDKRLIVLRLIVSVGTKRREYRSDAGAFVLTLQRGNAVVQLVECLSWSSAALSGSRA